MAMEVQRVEKFHLPFPTGPYATGCMELMTEYSPEGCFARIFYPTNIPTEHLEKYSDKWVPWMPHPMYLKAFAKTLSVPYFIFKYGQKLLGQGSYYIPTVSDAPLADKEQSYPLIIFSHGFAATRFICSDYCNSLASYGFIVATIEHRDTSSSITFYYESPENADADIRTWIHHQDLHLATNNKNVDHYTIRNNQMKLRHRECVKLLDTILKINEGVPVKNVLKSSFDLNQFKNKINVDKIISSGYSFGGATAMYNAAYDNRYRSLIVLDGWMFPLKSEQFLNINLPILFINTQTFHIPANLNLLCQYFYSKGIRQLYTLKNTTHESPTDTPYIHGYWLNLLMQKLNAKTALNLHSSLTVKFLGENIGYPNSYENAQLFIKEHANDLVEDVIRYSTRIKRKIGVYPW